MSYLSTEQRQIGIKHNQAYDAALVEDEKALLDRLSQVRELRRCVAFRIETIGKVEAGECDADFAQTIDDAVRECLRTGMIHYPVVITSGDKKVVRAS